MPSFSPSSEVFAAWSRIAASRCTTSSIDVAGVLPASSARRCVLPRLPGLLASFLFEPASSPVSAIPTGTPSRSSPPPAAAPGGGAPRGSPDTSRIIVAPGPAERDGVPPGHRIGGGLASPDVTERSHVRPLVGREEDLGALVVALESVRRGRMATVFLSGDAGVGKTRLVQELVARAEGAGAPVLLGGASDIAESPPFWPVASALRALLRSPRGAEVRQLLAPWSDQLDELVLRSAVPAPLARVQTLELLHRVVLRHGHRVRTGARRRGRAMGGPLHPRPDRLPRREPRRRAPAARRDLPDRAGRGDHEHGRGGPHRDPRAHAAPPGAQHRGGARCPATRWRSWCGPRRPAVPISSSWSGTGRRATPSSPRRRCAPRSRATPPACPRRCASSCSPAWSGCRRLRCGRCGRWRCATARCRTGCSTPCWTASRGCSTPCARAWTRAWSSSTPAADGYRLRHGLMTDVVVGELLPGERMDLHRRYATALEAGWARSCPGWTPAWPTTGTGRATRTGRRPPRWRRRRRPTGCAATPRRTGTGCAPPGSPARWPRRPSRGRPAWSAPPRPRTWPGTPTRPSRCSPSGSTSSSRRTMPGGTDLEAALLHARTGQYLVAAGRGAEAAEAFGRATARAPAGRGRARAGRGARRPRVGAVDGGRLRRGPRDRRAGPRARPPDRPRRAGGAGARHARLRPRLPGGPGGGGGGAAASRWPWPSGRRPLEIARAHRSLAELLSGPLNELDRGIAIARRGRRPGARAGAGAQRGAGCSPWRRTACSGSDAGTRRTTTIAEAWELAPTGAEALELRLARARLHIGRGRFGPAEDDLEAADALSAATVGPRYRLPLLTLWAGLAMWQ